GERRRGCGRRTFLRGDRGKRRRRQLVGLANRGRCSRRGGSGSLGVVVDGCDHGEDTFIAIYVRAGDGQTPVSACYRHVLVDGAGAPVDRGRDAVPTRRASDLGERRRGCGRRAFLRGNRGKRRRRQLVGLADRGGGGRRGAGCSWGVVVN